MFGSKAETIVILAGLTFIVAVIASLFINPAITVVVFTVMAWLNVLVVILLCDPLGLTSPRK
ncbi:MAG: hypothetical protein WCF85_11880 [Rhodospirillaceae bacterium]